MLADAPRDVEHAYLALIVDYLEKITITGDDVNRHRRRACQRPDDVIRFVAVLAADGDAKSIQHRQDQRDLYSEPFWRYFRGGTRRARHLGHHRVTGFRDPMSFVGRNQLHPPAGPPVI